MSLLIKTIRGIDKYFVGLVCLVIGMFSKKQKKKPNNIKSIAIIKLWAIGDSVTTLPLIKQLKEKYKKSSLTVIATKRNVEVYAGLEYIDNILILEAKNLFKIIKLYNKFDLSFDLEPYLNFSAILAWFIGRYRAGFSNQTRSGLYNTKTEFFKNKHIVKTYLDMGTEFGTKKTKNLEKLSFSKKDKEKVEDFLKITKLDDVKPIIGVCPGAAESVRERMWPKERFAQLADKLISDYEARIVFVGSPKEAELIKEIQSLMKEKSESSAGKLTLKETFSLIEKCNIFISNDTGPMHIAAAQGCKVVGLFGPNTPKRWAPYGEGNKSMYHKMWCSPCIINEKGIMPKCINKEFQKCMKLISVEEVEKNVQSMIKN